MKKTKEIKVGNVKIGGGNPVSVQSMTNIKTSRVDQVVDQIKDLEKEGCQIIRCAISDDDDLMAIKEIKQRISLPIIADIQYDYRLAVESVRNGVDGLRINPGNIGGKDKVREIVNICKDKGVSIRVGVNGGSLKQDYIDKYRGVNENSMVYSALEQVDILESLGFNDIKISLKASSVNLTVKSYEKISKMVDYPLHLGITESGPSFQGTIKSSVGLGILLNQGIGDTIRVSITGDPVEEVRIARQILRSLDLLNEGIEIISCPTCGRTDIDLINLVKEAEKRLGKIDKNLKVAIMGCGVNGPGEAKEADIGIAGGKGEGVLFKKGKVIKKLKEEEILEALISEIEKI